MLPGFKCFLLAQPFADNVRPTKPQGQQRNQLLQAFQLNDVGLLKPETATLQTTERAPAISQRLA